MKILITGSEGLLGRALMRRLDHHECVGVDRDRCDITRPRQVDSVMREIRPGLVIHCAAMTAVDECESRPDEAWACNALGAANVAASTGRIGARLIAVSTDYVFGGELDRPYHEWDDPAPASVYGRTKLAGERAIRAHCPDHTLVRTAWLYGPGGPSFVHTMLKLARQGRDLRVVDDQRGNPTSTDALADALIQLTQEPLPGTVHLTCGGEASWCDLAREVFRLTGLEVDLQPCRSDEFPRPAARPGNSRLENRAAKLAGLTPLPHWKDALSRFLQENPDG